MCRLAYFSPAVKRITREKLADFLAHLERQQGGHGNGVACLPSTGKARVFKGLKLSVEECASLIMEAASLGMPTVFHTRVASVGQQGDRLCHPFRTQEYVIAHNGTSYTHSVIAKTLGVPNTVSDTMAFAHLFKTKGEKWMKEHDLWPTSGVWIIAHRNGGGYVDNLSGDLQYCPEIESWASDFPFKMDAYRVEEGRHPLHSTPPKKQWRSTSISSHGGCNPHTHYKRTWTDKDGIKRTEWVPFTRTYYDGYDDDRYFKTGSVTSKPQRIDANSANRAIKTDLIVPPTDLEVRIRKGVAYALGKDTDKVTDAEVDAVYNLDAGGEG